MDKFYWLNEDSRLTLERGYLNEGETPEGRIQDIADTAERILGIEGFSDKFYDYMGKGFYSLSSPVWSNFGKSRGFSISCFGSYIEDNVASLLDTASEVGMMSKHGGGTSGYFGNVRPRGAAITNNGESSGAVHFMELFEQMTDTISQGCYDDQTDILTEQGWMRFEELILRKGENIKVAQVNDNDTISYVVPSDYMKFKPEDSELMLFKDSKNIDILVTKNHNMEFKYDGRKTVDGERIRYLNPEYRTATAEYAPLHRDVKYAHSSMLPSRGEDSGLTAMERLYIAIQADGNLVKGFEHSVKFRFSKKRKADRIEGILKELNLDYSYNHYTHSDNTYNIYVNLGHVAPKLLIDWVDVSDKSLEWANEFLDEISYWDGTVRTSEYLSTHYSSIIESNVDVVQMVAAVAGAKSRKTVNYRETEPTKSTIFNIYVTGRSQTFGVEKLEPTLVEYDGYVYCVEVPSHRLIVRRNGHTLVCGNSTRRGKFTPYLPLEHDDIHEFLEIGTEGNAIQSMTTAVSVTDEWMIEMLNGDKDKRDIWAKVLARRTQMGYPYIFFKDNANERTVDVYKELGYEINNSNLCSEIMLPNNDKWSFVCNLSSMNLERFDDWKDTDAVETMVYFLDAVMTEFISDLERMRDSEEREERKSFVHMERAYNFAKANRALGLGVN